MANYIATQYTFGLGGDGRIIIVEWRSDDKWTITDRCFVYDNLKNSWEYEPQPSNRSEEFLQGTRYSLDKALELAEKLYEKEKQELKEWKEHLAKLDKGI